jgi:hypothetical protein
MAAFGVAVRPGIEPEWNVFSVRKTLEFEYPADWITYPGETTMNLHDRVPPTGNMIIQASFLGVRPTAEPQPELPTALEWLRQYRIHEGDVNPKCEPIAHPVLDLAFSELTEMHPTMHRVAVWRSLIVRTKSPLIGVITFGFFPEVRDRAEEIWDHMLSTLLFEPAPDL